MSPFYCLGSLLLEQKVKDQRWTQWCDEWAEWIMNDLPRTKERGFQHSESRALVPPLVTRAHADAFAFAQ